MKTRRLYSIYVREGKGWKLVYPDTQGYSLDACRRIYQNRLLDAAMKGGPEHRLRPMPKAKAQQSL